MKIGKRLAAFAAALIFSAFLLPTAAFAADATPTPTATATATPSASPAATPVVFQNYQPGNVAIKEWSGTYQIGTLDMETYKLTPTTSVSKYTSDLTLRIYFEGTPSAENYVVDKSNFDITGGNLNAQDVKAYFYKNALYMDVVGLKYENDTDNDFRATLTGCNNTIFLQIGECTRAAADATPTPTASAEPTPTPDPRAPGLIIKSSSISEEAVNAGDEFKLNLTVYATSSGTEDVLDVLVSIAPEKGVMVANGSSTKYIGNMKPGTSQTVSFPMKAQADFTEGVSTVAVTLSGTGASAGTAANATGTTISVPIKQPDRFQISKVEVPESIMVGEEQMATITFVNMGKNPVNNLTLDFACDNCQESKQNQYVGNLAAGTEDSVDFDLCPIQAGALSGTITVTYEASNGESVTQTQEISATVEESMMYEDSDMMEGGEDMPVDAPAAALPWWGMLLIVAAIVAAIVAVVLLLRHRKAKKQKALEAEDEDL